MPTTDRDVSRLVAVNEVLLPLVLREVPPIAGFPDGNQDRQWPGLGGGDPREILAHVIARVDEVLGRTEERSARSRWTSQLFDAPECRGSGQAIDSRAAHV